MGLIAVGLFMLVCPPEFVSAKPPGPTGSESAEIVPSQAELQLMAKINEARKNPLQTAGELGLDPQTVLEQRPELKEILINGLPPLKFNENLYTAALMHTRDMLAQKYYASISEDGRTVSERMNESGYIASASGENLGMLAFINFLPAELAVSLIFENMFRDELSPDKKCPINILNPGFIDIGVYLGTGSWVLQSTKYNVYLATCDFGNDGVTYPEQVLIALINQARSNPIKTAAALGMDLSRLFENRLDLFTVLNRGLPPVNFSQRLYTAARGHVLDMLEKDYFSHISPDGGTLSERLIEQGYEAIAFGEAIGAIISDSIENSVVALNILFENQFKAEFTYESIDKLLLLNPYFNEIGAGFEREKISGGEDASIEENNFMVVFDLAETIIEKPRVLGVVYRDINPDGNYSPGEGIGSIMVQIIEKSQGIVNEVETDLSGSFSVEMEPGCYTARVIREDEVFDKNFEINEFNKFIEIKIE